MNPLLTEALVGPRQDDLRRSARLARAATLRSRGAAPATPLPAWTVALRTTPRPALAGDRNTPCAEC
jgi:hypothetical protein